MDHIREQLASITCDVMIMIAITNVIWISRVTESRCPAVIWNSGSWRYMYLLSKCNEKLSCQIELCELYMTWYDTRKKTEKNVIVPIKLPLYF